MYVSLDMDDPTPIYEQLILSIKELVNRGDLKPGDSLPTVRQLAQDLGVNLNTVARAYRELAGRGVLSVRQGRGAYVTSHKARPSAADRKSLSKRLKGLVNEAVFFGIGPRELHTMLDSELAWIAER